MMSIFDGIKYLFCNRDIFKNNGYDSYDRNQNIDNIARSTSTIRNHTLQLDHLRGQMLSFKINLDRVEAGTLNSYIKYYNQKFREVYHYFHGEIHWKQVRNIFSVCPLLAMKRTFNGHMLSNHFFSSRLLLPLFYSLLLLV